MPAVATYAGIVKVAGGATAFTGEAMSLVSGKTYQIDDTAKRVWDGDTAVTVYDGGSPVAANDIESIDYLRGIVIFDASYTVGGAVTVDGDYLPLLDVTKVRSYNWSGVCELLDDTCFDTAGERTRIPGLIDASGSFETLEALNTDLDPGGGTVTLAAFLSGREDVYLQVGPDSSTFQMFRVNLASLDTSGAVDDLRSSSVNWNLSSYISADGNLVGISLP
jgi:hypothetical protein